MSSSTPAKSGRLQGRNEFTNDIELSEDSTSEACWSSTGKPPVSKWIDTKKGEGVGSRLVAGDFKVRGDKDSADVFASTSPLGVIKAVLVLARQDLGKDIVAVLIDVRRPT